MLSKHHRARTARFTDWQAARSALRLLDWRAGAVVVLSALALLLVAQVPFGYSFTVGRERGPASDQPFLQNFNPPELNETGSWRWSRGDGFVTVPGVGRRGVVASFDVVSHEGQWNGQSSAITLRTADGQATPISLRPERARYHIYLPPEALPDGVLRLQLEAAPWQQPNDRRTLGVALGDTFTVASVRPAGPALPDVALWLGWPLGLALAWLALGVLGFHPRWLLLPWALVVPLAALFEAPRLGFGGIWAVQAGLIALAAAVVAVTLVPRLLGRHTPHVTILRWLLLLMVASFVLKYGGRLYPASMPGDIGLHDNRYQLTITGHVFIRAQHRGLPFPFPPALYLLVAPLTLTGLHVRTIFELVAGLSEASTVLLLYLLLARASGSARLGLLAAATYAITAGGFMTTWFAFQTHVAAQWFSIAFMLLLVWRWPRYTWWDWGLMTMLLAQVFLGHIGLFLNTALLGLLLVPVLWWRARTPEERHAARSILTAGLTAGLSSALFYYSAFAELAIEQVVGTATQGLNEVTGKQPIPRATSLWVLWEGGLITHFGFFPVLLAGAGMLLFGARRGRRGVLLALLGLTFLVSASQAVLPFITLSSITTRWLMFSAWAIAVAAAVGVAALWQRGWGARLVTLAMAGYVAWVTLGVWLDAAFLRKPPIEPF